MFAVQPLSQQDPRWKNKRLGDDTITIGKFGCLLTCMTMVANGFGASETPDSLNGKMRLAGGFIGALVIPARLPSAVPGVRFIKYIPCEGQPAPLAEIDSALGSGKPVIVEVDYSPAKGLQNHWVVLTGKKGGDYLIADPWPFPVETKEMLLTQRYGFAGSSGKIIQGAVWFDGIAQPSMPKPEPVAIEDTGFSVYAAADGLALRQEPFVSDVNLIKRLPLQARFYVKEPAAQAKAKIGAMNQWLNVQDATEGYVGYVAAWYVSATPAPAPEPVPAPAPAPVQPAQPAQPVEGSFIVFAAADGLALRTQPLVSDATLIKRLPLNAEFTVLEPETTARPKLGVMGQWLKLRDIESSEGYAAAWYLADKRQEDVLGVAVAPASARLVVRTITEDVALRSQPVISGATLIKREPLGSEMLVLEHAHDAVKKIGVVNQWLRVRDSAGVEGYMAAWYVIQRPEAATP